MCMALMLACHIQSVSGGAPAALPVLVFDGAKSYVTIASWKPVGRWGVFAQFAGAIPADKECWLLAAEDGATISVRSGHASFHFAGKSFSVPLPQTPVNGYCAIFIEPGKMTGFDGYTMSSVTDTGIVTMGNYSLIGQHGRDHSTMQLHSLVLCDYATPTNSRCYLAQDDGSFTDVVHGGATANTFSTTAGTMDKPLFTPPRASNCTTVAQWEQQYAGAGYLQHNPCWVAAPTRLTEFGELFAWSGSYWLETYLVIYNTTTNTVYLDRAGALIDYMFANTDRVRFDRGEITCTNTNGVNDAYADGPKPLRFVCDGGAPKQGVPGEGWRRYHGKLQLGMENIVLIDGVITSGIAKYCHYVLSRPALARYHENAHAYLRHCATIIHAHDTTWSATKNPRFASYYYLNDNSDWGDKGKWSGAVAYNHSLAAATTMAICNKWIGPDESFSNKISSILAFWHQFTWRLPGGGIAWWYEWRPDPHQAKSQDIGHAGNLEIADLYWLARLGYPIRDADFRDIVTGIEKNCEFSGTGLMSFRIDGSYKYPGDQVANPAYTSSVAQNMRPVAVFAPALTGLARRAARVGGGTKTTFNWWGDFAVAAFDIADTAGCLDIAAQPAKLNR